MKHFVHRRAVPAPWQAASRDTTGQQRTYMMNKTYNTFQTLQCMDTDSWLYRGGRHPPDVY